jgi:hypothetical protein
LFHSSLRNKLIIQQRVKTQKHFVL